jgi:hypothetical protein
MRTRSTIARGAATLALVVGVVATTSLATTAPAYAATKKHNDQSTSSTESNQDITDEILGGIHFAADAADFVVPIVVNVLHPEN